MTTEQQAKPWRVTVANQDAEIDAAVQAVEQGKTLVEVLKDKPRSWVMGFVLRGLSKWKMLPRDIDTLRQRLHEMGD